MINRGRPRRELTWYVLYRTGIIWTCHFEPFQWYVCGFSWNKFGKWAWNRSGCVHFCVSWILLGTFKLPITSRLPYRYAFARMGFEGLWMNWHNVFLCYKCCGAGIYSPSWLEYLLTYKILSNAMCIIVFKYFDQHTTMRKMGCSTIAMVHSMSRSNHWTHGASL
jgi:hypothetical protein